MFQKVAGSAASWATQRSDQTRTAAGMGIEEWQNNKGQISREKRSLPEKVKKQFKKFHFVAFF